MNNDESEGSNSGNIINIPSVDNGGREYSQPIIGTR